MEVCRHFLSGRCAFGSACRLAHVQPGAAPPPGARAGGACSSSSGSTRAGGACSSSSGSRGGSAFGGGGGGGGGGSSWNSAPPAPPVPAPYQADGASAYPPWPEADPGDFPAAAAAASGSTVAGGPFSEQRESEVKELRKLQKALREIEALEMRQDAGEGLQGNQLKKIQKRPELELKMRQVEESIRQLDAAPQLDATPELDVSPQFLLQQETFAPPPEICPRVPIGPPTGPICRHFLAGRCSFGDACRNSHVIEGAPAARARPLEPSCDLEDPECGICFESILKKGERFGILENCDHAFCLSCIRSWRKQREQQDRHNLRLCPVCRNESFFIVPSDTMLVDPEEKRRVISSYKVDKSALPCKLFDYGRGNCPFGNSCFYAHLNPDGTRYIPPALHWRRGADGSEVQAEVKLSDFLAHSLALP